VPLIDLKVLTNLLRVMQELQIGDTSVPPGLFYRVFLRQLRKKAILGSTSVVRADKRA
jgi:hypothetical protein